MKKIAGFFLLLLSIAALGLWWITDHVLPYAPIRPHRVQLEQQPEFAAGTLPSDFGLAYDTFSVRTFDSLTLQGYYIPAPDAIATVVLLHGIGGCKEHFYALSRQLNAIGCNAVLFDHRAQGQSEGMFCTFGEKEKYDVSAVADLVKKRYNDSIIGIYGSSLGGAIGLQSLAIRPDFRFGIIESTYHNLEAVTNEYFRDIAGFYLRPVVKRSLKRSGLIADFHPFTTNPEDVAAQITCPVFMAHGSNDEKIPSAFGRRNFDQLASKEKHFELVAGAGHLNLHQVGGEEYWGKLADFILESAVIGQIEVVR